MPDAVESRAAISPAGVEPTGGVPLRKGHTASSAALLLMASSFLSGLLALVRQKYINYLFGAGVAQDAYRAAFKLPDLLNYFLIGGAASISVITILNRYRERGDEQGESEALSVILTTMLFVLTLGVVLCEFLAPAYTAYFLDGFSGEARSLCTSLTRILLPAQLFFFLGSTLSSRLQVRKIFIYQAFSPLVYNGCIIAGAVLLHKQMGVYSLAIGVLAGVICGSALLNAVGAFRTGLRYKPVVNFRHPAFVEWFQLSLPLMLGVSLVMFDGIFINKFASHGTGGVSLINNAKDLFNAPFNIIGPAAGAASLPFFASLFQQGRLADFSAAVNRAVSRLFAVGMIVSSGMMVLAPWLMDLFRGGKFNAADVLVMRHLFLLFSFTLAVWAVQGIYARAFYAASDTRTPAISGTVIVLLSIPLYWGLFRSQGLSGLAIASDIGIFVQTGALAVLLHKRRLVSIAELDVPELAKAALAAIVSGLAMWFQVQHLPASLQPHGFTRDLMMLAAGGTVWALLVFAVLALLKSKLPKQVLRRRAA